MTIESREKDKTYLILLAYAFTALGTFLTPYFYYVHVLWLFIALGVLINNHNRNVSISDAITDLAKDKKAAQAYNKARAKDKVEWDDMTQIFVQRFMLVGIIIDYVMFVGLIITNHFLSK